VTRKYEEGLSYGDTIHVPQVNHLNGRTKDMSANTAVVFETNTETSVNILINVWGYAAQAYESAAQKQSYKDQIELYAPELGYALALQVDDDLAGLVDDFGTNVVGSMGTPPTFANFTKARRLLNDANVPRKGRFVIGSPAFEEGLLDLAQYINNDYSKLQGSVDDDDDMGLVGSWMKVPIYISTNVEGDNTVGHDNTMMHPEAITVVMQVEPTTHRWFDINYLAQKVVVEQLYGVKEMRDDHGVWLKSA
jgi:hypothetical protein